MTEPYTERDEAPETIGELYDRLPEDEWVRVHGVRIKRPSDPDAEVESRAEQDPPVYRVGRSVSRTVYRQRGVDPAKGDELIGVMNTRELAAQVVEALNAIAKGRLRQPGDRPEWDVLREAAAELRRRGEAASPASEYWRGLASSADDLEAFAAAAESRAGKQP